jgi:16S rRNA (guanine(527)-N(7))-methyltransferase RsmG
VKHDPRDDGGLAGAIRALDLAVPAEAVGKLESFERMLLERAIPMGLVSRSDADRIRERHILDCLTAIVVVRSSDTLAYDVGSGAGLPGAIVAICRPHLQVRLVEPRRSRVAFLEWVVEKLGIPNAVVMPARIEDQRESADLCFSRAFAPLPDAWGAALPLLRPGGRLVYFAGETTEAVGPLAGASDVSVLESSVLAWPGRLIIMTR